MTMNVAKLSTPLLLLVTTLSVGCSSDDNGSLANGGSAGSAPQGGRATGGSGGASAGSSAANGGGTLSTGGTSPSASGGKAGGPASSGGAAQAGGGAAQAGGGAAQAGGGGTQNSAGSAGTAINAGGSSGAAGRGGNASGGSGAGSGGSTAGSGGGTTVACDPADQGPEATPIDNIGTGIEPAGMFATVVESDPGIADQTIFRPEPLGAILHPVLTWGNGGCMKSNSGFSEFLLQLAAEGIVVIADGTPNASGSSGQDGGQLINAIDWIEAENERPCSKYYHKIDLTKIGVSGQSCGGLMALNASDDPRVAVSMPMNSGLMQRNTTLYGALHAPMAIINGGPDDIAYENGLADFNAIDNIPMLLANIPVGHGGTYREDNGGEMGQIAIAWLRWHLLKDEGATGKGMFIGDSCGLCSSEWELQWKNKPM